MTARVLSVLLLCFVCKVALADTLVMRSGENKKGRIIEETEKAVLFNSEADGLVVEVPRDEIAILDRDVESSAPSKGHVQIFSEVPKKRQSLVVFDAKKNEPLPAPAFGTAPKSQAQKTGSEDRQAAAFQTFMKLIEDWVRSNPESEKYIQEWMAKFKGNQDEVEKVAKIANEA